MDFSYQTIGVLMTIVLAISFFLYEEIQEQKRNERHQAKMKQLYAEGELILDNYRKLSARIERMLM